MSEGGKEWDSGCESEGVSDGGKEWLPLYGTVPSTKRTAPSGPQGQL